MMQSLIPTARFVATMMLVPPALAEPASLYTRLGGEAVVSQVVDQTINTMTQDPRFNRSFDRVNLARLKRSRVEHICAITGGGCVYTGDDIKKVHKGLKITKFEFNGEVAALRQALDDHCVGEREKNELLAILAPMIRLVVEK